MSRLEFVPFDAPYPNEGLVLDLAVANPDHAEELAAYQTALELNPFAVDDVLATLCPRLAEAPESLLEADELCLAIPRITLVVGYPFAGQWAVGVAATAREGFTLADLFRQIVRVYRAMYEDATIRPLERLYNRQVESPQFGVAYHRFDDLVVERVLLTEHGSDVFAWISIGS